MDDGVHAVGRLSGLAQVLDAKVTEEKALDVLDGVLQNRHIVEEEVLHKENLDQTLLVGCNLRRGDDGGHRHHERRRQRLRMELRTKDIEMTHVEEQRLRASVRSELVRAPDEPPCAQLSRPSGCRPHCPRAW